jgi:S-DNA-T family DNA segregation ATPase FtsK/SpoIIIE
MARGGTQKGGKKPPAPPARPPRPARARLGLGRQEVAGCALLVLASVTVLGLSRVSSGQALTWWAETVHRLLGWGVYPMVLAVGFLGLRLVWRDLGRWLPLGPEVWLGLELLLLVLLVASHAPLVQQLGADGALLAAQQGRAGGLVGWALAVPLVEELGMAVGSLVLAAALCLALVLLVPLSWRGVQEWLRRRSRSIAAAWGRLQAKRQGTPVVPQPPEKPWWEQEPDPSQAGQRPRSGARSQKPPKAPRGKQAPPPEQAGSLPPLDLLDPVSPQEFGDTDVRRKTQIIEETLASFGVPARVVDVRQGPTVTQFGLDPGFVERRAANGQPGRQRVRVGRIASLVDDLALALAAAPLRIEAPVPGRSVVGLEVPNETVSLVSLRGVMESTDFRRLHSRLAIALGEDVSGHPVAVDLGLMPHLLIAGATGSGKSVCINAIVCCLLFGNTPADLRLLMVDPKMVELIGYNGIPHLLAPVITEPEQVVSALAWATRQMDERYRLFHGIGVRNLETYNQWMGRRKGGHTLPTLVVFVDELADLMMVAPEEVERHICRLAQMGRATGIHLVIATQRPSVDVVTGLIKANFPSRISFAVTSQTDSRVILDQNGAESLLGRGDMLFMAPQISAPIRLQGCFVSDAEIERLCGFWRGQDAGDGIADTAVPWAGMELDEKDDLLDRATQVTQGRERISTSFLQRQLRIGFPRAARLMDQLEELGVVGPDEGAGRGRQVLIDQAIDLDKIAERQPGKEPD